MTGKEALRRLRAAGWNVVRDTGKHAIVCRETPAANPQTCTTIPLGTKLSRRAEAGVMRLLAGRGTRRELRGRR